MGNPDHLYAGEQARRAELWVEAAQERRALLTDVMTPLTTRVHRAMRRLTALLAGAHPPRMSDEPRR